MKIGIITMHRVRNFGSVLQSYALVKKIEEIGFECEIIDYLFEKKQRLTIKQRMLVLLSNIKDIVCGSPRTKQKKKFDEFMSTYYKLSDKSYHYKDLREDPPTYDIYIAGSDQVWNPRHVLSDDSFLLSFVDNSKKKCSYASSFATQALPEEYHKLYRDNLSSFSWISVREQTGAALVQTLIAKPVTVCVDPTLLLTKEHWSQLAQKSELNIADKYILVYALYYMFDPYPELKRIIEHVRETLNCKVIYLNGRQTDYLKDDSIVYKSGGPLDFLYLIKNAEFVITTSFHGSLFSLLFGTPVMGIVKAKDKSDDRLTSLFAQFASKGSVIPYNSKAKWTKKELLSMKGDHIKIDAQRQYSISYLKSILN